MAKDASSAEQGTPSGGRLSKALGAPSLQGIGALVGIIAFVLAAAGAIWQRVRNIHAGPVSYVLIGALGTGILVGVTLWIVGRASRAEVPVEPTPLVPAAPRPAFPVASGLPDEAFYEESESGFYRRLVAAIGGARSEVYRSGTGFNRPRHIGPALDVLKAERHALENHVTIKRIQTAPIASDQWAEGLAGMMIQFRGQVVVHQDYASENIFDVCLIDPLEDRPFILLLREVEDMSKSDGSRYRFEGALILHGYRPFARSMLAWFDARLNSTAPMSADQVRELARTVIYFAYGTHMYSGRMRQDASTFRRLGQAFLPDWLRSFSVEPTGVAIGLRKGAGTPVEGVAYEISEMVMTQLNHLERQFEPTNVMINFNGAAMKAFTYVPRSPTEQTPAFLGLADVNDMIAGARENRLACLAELLEVQNRAGGHLP